MRPGKKKQVHQHLPSESLIAQVGFFKWRFQALSYPRVEHRSPVTRTILLGIFVTTSTLKSDIQRSDLNILRKSIGCSDVIALEATAVVLTSASGAKRGYDWITRP